MNDYCIHTAHTNVRAFRPWSDMYVWINFILQKMTLLPLHHSIFYSIFHYAVSHLWVFLKEIWVNKSSESLENAVWIVSASWNTCKVQQNSLVAKRIHAYEINPVFLKCVSLISLMIYCHFIPWKYYKNIHTHVRIFPH